MPFDELGLPKKWKCGCGKRDKYNHRIHECYQMKGRHIITNYYGNVVKII